MAKYLVTIVATIVQAIPVDAISEDQAVAIALEIFDVDELENEISFIKTVARTEELK